MFKNVSFLSLWINQSFFRLGDSLYIIGVVTLLYTKTQSALLAALFPFIRVVTILLSGILAPFVMQKLPLRSILIYTQVLQGLVLFALTLYLNYWELYLPILSILLILFSLLEGWSSPSRNAMLPRVVEEKDLVRANSMIGTTDQIALFAGYSLGGIIVAMMGTVNCLWISVAFVLSSTVFSFFIKDQTNEPSTSEGEKKGEGLKDTWFFVYKHPLYRRLFVMDSIEYMAGAVWAGAITLVFVKEILHRNEAWWGFLNGAYLLGTALGGFVAIVISKWLKRKLKSAFIIGSANLGILTIIFALSFNPILTIILFFLMGIPYQIRDVALRTLLQINTNHKQLPQVFSVHQVVGNISFAVGLIVMGAITEYCGPQIAYFVSAIMVLFSAWMARSLPVQESK